MSTIRKTSPRRREVSPRAHVATALVAIAAGVAFVWFALIAPNVLPGLSHYTVSVELDRLAGVRNHDEVRIAGRRVGQVLDPRVVEGRAVVDLRLDDAGPLPVDTVATVRSKGLLGQRYLELSPGDSGEELAEGATLPTSQTEVTVDLPELLGTFDRPTRAHLASLLDELGVGLAGRGRQLSEAIGRSPRLMSDSRAVAGAILDRPGAAARLFPSIRSAAATLDPVRDELAAALGPQAQAFSTLAENRPQLQALLETTHEALPAARSGLAESDPLLVEATALAHSATSALAEAPAALEETRTLMARSDRPLRRAVPLLDDLRSAIGPTIRLTDGVDPLLAPSREAIRESTPPVVELGSRPCDVIGWAANWRSMLEHGIPHHNPLGRLNTMRLVPITTPESLQKLGQELPSGLIGSNPYPGPCEAGTEGSR